jgi:3-methyladenine DNA glycosylase AlkD
MTHIIIKTELQKLARPEKAKGFQVFFKEGQRRNTKFLGIPVPLQRNIVNLYKELPLPELSKLLKDEQHECNYTALLFLEQMMESANDEDLRKKYFDFYCKHFDYINMWDLVDCSAPGIVGEYLKDKNRGILREFAKDKNFWVQRIAMVSTWDFIKNNQLDDTYEIAALLLYHKEDLIQKAVGWMLREAGKKDFDREYNYLIENDRYKTLPRTTLRYAIERFPEKLRQRFLKGTV